MTVHVPLRPDWRCVKCDAHWPCHTRRRQLTAEFTGASASLGLYLASCMVDAAADLPDTSAGCSTGSFLAGYAPPNAVRDAADADTTMPKDQ
jgi:hypothetical protein